MSKGEIDILLLSPHNLLIKIVILFHNVGRVEGEAKCSKTDLREARPLIMLKHTIHLR